MGAVDVGGGGPKQKGGGRRKPRRRGVRIDMTPMVDVAFLLLIFFMVTTVFRRPQALELTLPAERAEIEVPEGNVMQIRVTSAGKLFTNIGLDAPQPVEVTKLHEVVGAHRSKNPALCAVIKIDRQAPYHWMVDVLDEVTIGNLSRYSLAPYSAQDSLSILGVGGQAQATPAPGGKG
jgi:biopolymer transport protein ExbD